MRGDAARLLEIQPGEPEVPARGRERRRSGSAAQGLRHHLHLRDSELAKTINAVFQIRIRIGANIGHVTIGNFGPDGAKQWDVVGNAVIDAKRMESTAPIGGLRISKELYDKLVETRVADEYYRRFLREALVLGSYYRDITRDDLFKYSEVLLKDKRGATFETYSVQVTPNLPESIAQQVSDLLAMGPSAVGRILKLLEYYRGNPYVINAIEDSFRDAGVVLRKHYMLETMYPLQLQAIHRQFDGNIEKITEHVDTHFSLYQILDRLGRFQDIVKQRTAGEDGSDEFTTYEAYMSEREHEIRAQYEASRKQMVQRAYFFNVVFPLVFESIRSSILEYQLEPEELETLRSRREPRSDATRRVPAAADPPRCAMMRFAALCAPMMLAQQGPSSCSASAPVT